MNSVNLANVVWNQIREIHTNESGYCKIPERNVLWNMVVNELKLIDEDEGGYHPYFAPFSAWKRILNRTDKLEAAKYAPFGVYAALMEQSFEEEHYLGEVLDFESNTTEEPFATCV